MLLFHGVYADNIYEKIAVKKMFQIEYGHLRKFLIEGSMLLESPIFVVILGS